MAYTVCASQKLRQTAGCDLTRLGIKEAFPFRGFRHVSVRSRAALWGEPPGPETEMTDEQDYMLRTVLRNQEVIMNALADLLTGDPRGRIEEQHRDKILADLGTCVGVTHYYLEDLRTQEQFRKRQRQTKN
jgi:hypothetical protein